MQYIILNHSLCYVISPWLIYNWEFVAFDPSLIRSLLRGCVSSWASHNLLNIGIGSDTAIPTPTSVSFHIDVYGTFITATPKTPPLQTQDTREGMKGDAIVKPWTASRCRVLGRYLGTVSLGKCKCPALPRALVPGTCSVGCS